VVVSQAGNPLTVWRKTATSSLMQAEYSATVAVQVEGRTLQPGLAVDLQAVARGMALPNQAEGCLGLPALAGTRR
jgi:hypothetical protein